MNVKIPKNHITFEKRQLIEKLISEGKTSKEIRELTGLSKQGIRRELSRCIPRQYNAQMAQETYKKTWSRRGESRHILSEEEIKAVRLMMEKGLSRSSIRKALGVSYDFIQRWFSEHIPDYEGGKINNLEERLSCVEMQLEILFDLIKDKK